jgi:hypothetical protein
MMVGQSKVHLGSSEAAEASTPVPTIKFPLNGTGHAPGRVFIEGGCLQGATVDVLNHDDSKLGSAVVSGESWYYSRNWDEGTKVVRARQIVAGVPSVSTTHKYFYVMSPLGAPHITYPRDGSRYSEGVIVIEGTCSDRAKSVELLNHDFSVLGYATIAPSGLTWSFSRFWDKGVKHVKAREVWEGGPNDPSGQIEFIVR